MYKNIGEYYFDFGVGKKEDTYINNNKRKYIILTIFIPLENKGQATGLKNLVSCMVIINKPIRHSNKCYLTIRG